MRGHQTGDDGTRFGGEFRQTLIVGSFGTATSDFSGTRILYAFLGIASWFMELSALLEVCSPGGGHDPRVLTAGHMDQFVADQRQRELDGLPALGARGAHGKPSIVTTNTRQAVFFRTRRLLRGALESGEADRLGLDRGFSTAMPAAGRVIQRTRAPFTDEVARALADGANLQKLAPEHGPRDHGLRDVWETIIVTGRRCGEVLGFRMDCLGRYGGLPMLWHDQTKVGNYDEAIRIPEWTYQLLEARQRKTLALFEDRNGRPPASEKRGLIALFPSSQRKPRLPPAVVLQAVQRVLQVLDGWP